jgi:O-antigen ligase
MGWDDHYYRMVGTLLDPNYLGLLLILVFVWGFFKEKSRGGKLVAVGAVAGLVATFSRMSWLTLVIILSWYVIRYKRNWWMVVGTILTVGVYLLLPKPGGEGVNLWRTYSVSNRIENWVQTGIIIGQNPWTGIGFNQYASVVKVEGRYGAMYLPKSPDNSFLFVLVTAGIPGLISFIWLIWWWWKQSRDLTLKLSLAAILIHAMANNSFFYPFILMWWWLLLAYQQQQANENS